MKKEIFKSLNLSYITHYRSFFLLAFLTLFSMATQAAPDVPTGFTEVPGTYDDFGSFNPNTSGYVTQGNWSKQNSGSEIGGGSDYSAYCKLPSTGDYVGKTMTLEAGTYIFSYYVKRAKGSSNKFKLCWDPTDLTKSSEEFELSNTAGGGDPGEVYESGEFTVTAGDYDLCTYMTSADGSETKVRVDGFYLYKKNAPAVALKTTFIDRYKNSTTPSQEITESAPSAGITVPTVADPTSWTFYGWAEESTFNADSEEAPTVLIGGSTYYPSSEMTYVAVYSWITSSFSCYTDQPYSITIHTTHAEISDEYRDAYMISFLVNAESNYVLPPSITMTSNGDTLTMGDDFDWDPSQGTFEFLLWGDEDLTITIDAVPAILGTFAPIDGTTGVSKDFLPTITFSEPIRYKDVNIVDNTTLQTAINNSFISLSDGTNDVAFTPSLSTDLKTVTLTPSSPLADFTSFTITLDTAEINNTSSTSAFSGPPSATFTTESLYPILDTPTGLAITVLTKTKATLSWTAVTGLTEYYVYLYDGTNKIAEDVTSDVNSYDFTLTDDLIGKELTFKVQAAGTSGASYDSEVANLTFTPSQLATPSVTTTAHDTSIELSWDAIEHATEYSIYVTGDDGLDATYTTTEASYTLTGLTAGTDYMMTVTAINGVEYINSETSTVDATTLAHYMVTLDAGHGTVSTSSFNVIEHESITLPEAICTVADWTFAGWSISSTASTTEAQTFVSSDYTPTKNIILYAVYQQSVSSGELQTITINSTNIESGGYSTHHFDVTGEKADGTDGDSYSFEGYYSYQSSIMQINSNKTAAYFGNTTPISGLSTIRVTNTSDGSADFDVYQLSTLETSPSASAHLLGTLAHNSTQTFDFVSGQGDYFLITPESSYGRISEVVITAAASTTTYDSNPIALVSAVFNFADEATDVALDFAPSITFSEPISYEGVNIVDNTTLQAAINNLFISLSDGTDYIDFTPSLSADLKTVTLTPSSDLADYTTFTVELDANNIKNNANQSHFDGPSSQSFTTVPGLPILDTPTGLAISALTKTTATLSWTAVTGLTEYYVYLYDGTNKIADDMTSGVNSYDFTLTDDLIGKELTFKVQAAGTSGVSYDSEVANLTFTPSQLATPSVTTTVHDTSIELSWDAVEHATEYSIYVTGDDGLDVTFTTPEVSYTFTGLTAGTDYMITVTAINGVDYINSETSDVDATTLARYTVTLDAGNGTLPEGSTIQVHGPEGESVVLADAIPNDSTWSFAGWSTTEISKQDMDPTLVASDYTFSADVTLYAVYQYSTPLYKKVDTQDELTLGHSYLFVNEADQKAMNNTEHPDGSYDHYLGSSDITISRGLISNPDEAVIWTIDEQTDWDGNFEGYSFQSQDNGAYLSSYENSNYDTKLNTTSHEYEVSSFGLTLSAGQLSMLDLSNTRRARYLTFYPSTAQFSTKKDLENNVSLYKNVKLYTHRIEYFTVRVTTDSQQDDLTQSSYVGCSQLKKYVTPFHSMTFVGWSESEMEYEGNTEIPMFVTMPILEDKSIYPVYQYAGNSKYYTRIPDEILTIDGDESTSSHEDETYTSIVVNENKSLAINSATHVKEITLNPGAKVTLNPNLEFTTEGILIFGQDDNPPAFSFPKDTTLDARLVYAMALPDNTRYHFFSLPYDCAYDNINTVGHKDNISIVEYNTEGRANGLSDNWDNLSSGDTLRANKGYNIATDLDHVITVYFIPTTDRGHISNEPKSIPLVSTHGTAGTGYQGWNLVGSPYLDATGKDHERQLLNVNFINQPNFADNCQSYHQVITSEATIDAFSAYFVQVGNEDSIRYTYPAEVDGAPRLYEDRLKLSLSSQTGDSDPTYIEVQPQYTTDYEIGSDLLKMLGQSTRPQFFSLSGTEQRAFNALPETAINAIGLGFYTGTTERFTITADNASRYHAAHVYLTDLKNQVTTDLMIAPYYFDGTAGELNTTRFVLNIVRYETPTDFDTTNDGGVQIYSEDGLLSINNMVHGSQLDIIDATGKIIYSQKVSDSNLNLKAATGLYIIRVTLANGSFTTYKTLLK